MSPVILAVDLGSVRSGLVVLGETGAPAGLGTSQGMSHLEWLRGLLAVTEAVPGPWWVVTEDPPPGAFHPPVREMLRSQGRLLEMMEGCANVELVVSVQPQVTYSYHGLRQGAKKPMMAYAQSLGLELPKLRSGGGKFDAKSREDICDAYLLGLWLREKFDADAGVKAVNVWKDHRGR